MLLATVIRHSKLFIVRVCWSPRPGNVEKLAHEGDKALPKHLPFAAPVQVKMKQGDMVLAHYQLAHSIAPNTSPRIRYGIKYTTRNECGGGGGVVCTGFSD